MRKFWPILVLLLTFTASCSPSASPTPTSIPASPTLPASTETPTQPPTFTPTLPTLTPTPILFEGTLIIKVNVRSGPGTTFESLGQLNGGEKIQILNQDKSKAWYQILYASASQGRGWVAAQYVRIPAGTEIPLDATPTPSGPTGVVTQRLNVRSGPATTFDSLGVLEAHTQVALTGKNSTASWFQIEYASAPAGLGWVTAQYIQTEAAAGLPVLDQYGTPVAASPQGTLPAAPMTPTPTLGPAFDDGDSQASPAVKVIFSAAGTRQFSYSSQVSAPAGDGEDWVEFTPYASPGTQARLAFSLTCRGNGVLMVELWESGSIASNWGSLSCGDLGTPVTLTAGQPYELRLAVAPAEGLRLVDYTLTVANQP